MDNRKHFFLPKPLLIILRNFLAGIVASLLLSLSASAQENLPIRFLEDKTAQLSVQEVLAMPESQFQLNTEGAPNLGFSHSALWLRVEMPNTKESKILSINNLHLDELDVYLTKNGSIYKQFQTGDSRSFSTRELTTNYFTFMVEQDISTIYVRVKSAGSVAIPIKIHHVNAFIEHENGNKIMLWIFYGVVLIAFVANLIFYLSLKDKIYLYYLFYVGANAIYTSTDLGLGFQYLWPDFPLVNKWDVILYSTSAFIFLFCDFFLELRSKYPKWHIAFLFIMGLIFASGIISLFNYNIGVQLFTFILAIANLAVIIASAYVYLQSKSKILLLFFFAWGIYMAGVMVYILAVLDIIPFKGNVINIYYIASTIEMTLFFVVVMFKINSIKEENIEAKTQIISLLSEKEKTLEEQNLRLENLVSERTRELKHKNDEILSQNEEIKSQMDEMAGQKKQLEEQSKEVDKINTDLVLSNQLLLDYKNKLEDLVKDRTTELEAQNEQLEQYAFMAAHNLRSPIAAIMGLSKLLESEKDPNAVDEITNRIILSTQKLDVVVKSMSNLLNARKDSKNSLEPILLETILEETMGIMSREIDNSNATISHDFSYCPTVLGIQSYLHNLFFNLINNSIKYQKEAIAPQIHISTEVSGKSVLLKFQDNGSGIDMERFGKDLFKPFKRFHDHVEGSGIGLHLVKTQIESIGGKIEVQSSPGEGTLFIVKLKK
jgi:two-component system, sensor histidine kinase LadS